VKFSQAIVLLCQWRGAEPLLDEVSRFYRVQLPRHSEAVAYLYQRGIRSWATIELMRIGYAPGGCLRGWLTRLGHHSERGLGQAGRCFLSITNQDLIGNAPAHVCCLVPELLERRCIVDALIC
jgi:hypothetical protein